MLSLDAATVAARLPYDRLIPALRLELGKEWAVPQRTCYDRAGAASLIVMPAWDACHVGVKIVNVCPGNAAHGLAAVSSSYFISNATTGTMEAMFDGEALTNRRTAAVAALAASFLTLPDADHLLVVGAGHVARELPAAFAAVRPIRRVVIWARDRERAVALAHDIGEQGFRVEVSDDLATSAADAPIIACATLSTEPLIAGRWLAPGAHLSLIGSFRPHMREADSDAIRLNYVFADSRAGVVAEAGDLLMPIAEGVIDATHIKADLFDLCRDGHAPALPTGVSTVFKSVGHAAQDLAAAKLCLADPAADISA